MESLPPIHARLQRVIIDNKDFRKIIPTYDSEQTLFYCDPPYIHETRRGKEFYDHEMELKDHEELVDLLLGCRGSFVLSCHDHPVYYPLEKAGAQKIQWEVTVYAHGQTLSRPQGTKRRGAIPYPTRVETLYVMRRDRDSRQIALPINLE